MIGRLARWVGWISGGLVLLLLGYGLTGLIGGALPVNGAWRPPIRGVLIFVESNGVHTDLVLPKRAVGMDLSAIARPQDLRDPRYAGHPYLAVGWGDRNFYENTPNWSDVRPGTIIAAAFGSAETVLHVVHMPRPVAASDVRPVLLRPDEYRRLASFVLAQAAPGGEGRPAYGRSDAFYPARGHYSAIHTCNDWTGQALRSAGVRVGRWTPFAQSVIGWF